VTAMEQISASQQQNIVTIQLAITGILECSCPKLSTCLGHDAAAQNGNIAWMSWLYVRSRISLFTSFLLFFTTWDRS
jgi:hypothetical protein